VIVANSTPTTALLQEETKTIPIVFATTSDPVGSGFVASLARPGGNITGFVNIEAEMAGKWLELLIEVAPHVRRAALMFNPDTAASSGAYYLPLFETAARSLAVTPVAAPVRNDADIETVLTDLGREPGGGLIVSSDGFVFIHRAQIIRLAARNKIPAVYYRPGFVRDGGLLSYGPDSVDIANQAAIYVHRILNGTKPAELPVQLPTKYQVALNVRTAKALGLPVPPSLLLRADEVIE
jgi:putative ABC transport system substrate-binding protein